MVGMESILDHENVYQIRTSDGGRYFIKLEDEIHEEDEQVYFTKGTLRVHTSLRSVKPWKLNAAHVTAWKRWDT